MSTTTQGVKNAPVDEASLPENISIEGIWNEDSASGTPYFVGEFYTCECNAELPVELPIERMRHMDDCVYETE